MEKSGGLISVWLGGIAIVAVTYVLLGHGANVKQEASGAVGQIGDVQAAFIKSPSQKGQG